MRYIAIDIETIGLNPFDGTIWMLSVTEGKKTNVYHNCNGLKLKDIPKSVIKDLTDKKVCKIIHNSLFDCPYMEMVWGIKTRNIWDTELMETVILGVRYSTKKKTLTAYEKQMLKDYSTKLNYVLPRYGFRAHSKDIRANFIDRPLGKKFSKEEINYAGDDTRYLPAIQKAQEYVLKRDSLYELGLLENLVSEKYHEMKVRGIGFSKEIWKRVADENISEYKKRTAKLPKNVANWNSPVQVKKYFQSKGILINSFSEIDEVYLQTKNKTLGDFIYAREFHKAVTSYGYNWFEPFKDNEGRIKHYIDKDGRIRCGVVQIINTGRNSMFDPNLQQLPGKGNIDYHHNKVMDIIRKRLGDEKHKWKHREAFVPAKGNVFVIADFSGQEMGIMAAMANEKIWIDAMLRRDDPHGLTASLINNSEWESAKEKGCTFPKKCKCEGHIEKREPAKINNFMLAYGGGPERLAKNTGMDNMSARMYCAAHKRVTPNLTRKLIQNGRDALATGVSYSADPYRRRRVLLKEEGWQIENQGKNTPIQSAGANMIKLAMASIPDEFPIVLVIHDEIIMEVKKADAKRCVKVAKQVMEKAADYITGIKGLIGVDPRIAMNIMKE